MSRQKTTQSSNLSNFFSRDAGFLIFKKELYGYKFLFDRREVSVTAILNQFFRIFLLGLLFSFLDKFIGFLYPAKVPENRSPLILDIIVQRIVRNHFIEILKCFGIVSQFR